MTRSLRTAVDEAAATAVGKAERHDPVLARTGGPAGNARLTAWFGLILLVLFLAESYTVLSLRQLVSLHILLGAALVPVVIAKTATTGWRIVRYYTNDPAYREAGPPPLLLRILGPLVVLTGLAVVGTGLALLPLGGTGSRTTITVLAGQRIDALTLHQAAFAAWLAVVGLHTLTRTVPALRLVGRHTPRASVPGRRTRATALVVTSALAAVVGLVVLHYSHWHPQHRDRFDGRLRGAAACRCLDDA